MADPDKRTDIEKLLAETDMMLTGAGGRPARRAQPEADPDHRSGGLTGQLRAAAVSGAVAATTVWVLFAVLPFLRATSGAVGAYLATFVAVVVFRRRR